MNQDQKKPVRSVNMATDHHGDASRRVAYHTPVYRVDLDRLGQMGGGTIALKMRGGDCALADRRLEPRNAPHLRFVGSKTAKDKPPTKHYSVDLDDFQS
jgi:hypothetical protein